MIKPSRLIVSTIAASALALAGCSNSEQDSTEVDSSQETTAAAADESTNDDADNSDDANDADDALEFEDGVVRAMAEDADMTAIFGTLVNESSEDIEVVGFESSIGAGVNEIHETVDGQMREMQEPLIIPAGESVTLEPGGAHFMLMEVADAVMAGDEITLSIELADGTVEEFDDVPVRNIGAGDEDYGDLGAHDHSDVGHSDAEHSDDDDQDDQDEHAGH